MRSSDRALAVLSAVGEAGPEGASLASVSAAVALPKPTALRFLRSLEPGGWVVRTGPGGYVLGPAVTALAGRRQVSDRVLVAADAPIRELRDRLGETVSLSRLTGSARVCVLEHPSHQSLRLVLGVGQTGPLHAGASGLVLLAALPAERRAEVLSGELRVWTATTLTSVTALELECGRVRGRGWAVSQGQKTAGGVAVAVPVRDPSAPYGTSVLGVFGPLARCRTGTDRRRWRDGLLDVANELEGAGRL